MRAVTLARLPDKVPHRSMCRSSLTRSSQCRTRPMSAFEDLHAIPPQLLAEGYLARAVHGERLTLAVVEVEPTAELPEHQRSCGECGSIGPQGGGRWMSKSSSRGLVSLRFVSERICSPDRSWSS